MPPATQASTSVFCSPNTEIDAHAAQASLTDCVGEGAHSGPRRAARQVLGGDQYFPAREAATPALEERAQCIVGRIGCR
jgi:hypothetical protein